MFGGIAFVFCSIVNITIFYEVLFSWIKIKYAYSQIADT